MQNSYNFIDLFSGCGGFSKGLEMAGHRCLLGVDFEPNAIKTFARNHVHAKTFLGDIAKLDSKTLTGLLDGQKIEMVVGGPPCQGFSTVGRGKVDDQRNKLFLEFVRIVAFLKPKVIMMENVTGLLAKKNRKILKDIFAQFEVLGYHLEAKVLSAEEFGVPERRRRTIIMGALADACVFPEVSHGPRGKRALKTVGEAIGNLQTRNGQIYNHQVDKAKLAKKLDADRLKHIPEGKGIRYKNDEELYLPKKLRFEVDWETLPEGRFRQTRLQRLDSKLPSPTILTSRTSYYHPSEARYLTAREAAACQSFPNDFIFEGSLTAMFRQIGNAVPPVLGQALGEAVKKIHFRARTEKKKKKVDLSFTKKAFRYSEHTVN